MISPNRHLSLIAIASLLILGCVEQSSHSVAEDVQSTPPSTDKQSKLLTSPVQSKTESPVSNISTWPTEEPLRDWKYIVFHHSATETGTVKGIDAVHRQRRDANGNPWRGIGYHFVIGNGNGMKDGEIQSTFRWEQQTDGAHAGSKTHNHLGVGICLIGNFEQDRPTPAQSVAARRLVSALQQEFGIEENRILGHSKLKATACPGRLFSLREILSGQKDDPAVAVADDAAE